MYNKTDENILHNLKEKNFKAIKAVNSELTRDTSDAETTIDGTKLILSQFIKYYGKDTKNHNVLLETIDKFKMVRNFNDSSTNSQFSKYLFTLYILTAIEQYRSARNAEPSRENSTQCGKNF